MTDNFNSIEIKPGFDGRLSFFAVFEEYMKDLRLARLNDNLPQQLNALENLYMMCAPYIKTACKEEIRAKLKEANNKLHSGNKSIRNSAKNVLYDASCLIHSYGKHLMLPSNYNNSEDAVDWDMYDDDPEGVNNV